MMKGKRIAGILLSLCLLLQLLPPVLAANAQAAPGARVLTITVELTEPDVSPVGAPAAALASGSFSGVYGDQLDALARELYDAYRA